MNAIVNQAQIERASLQRLVDTIDGSTIDAFEWILQAFREGHHDSSVLKILHESGWHQEVSRQMVKSVQAWRASNETLVHSVGQPSPDLDNFPALLNAGDRAVQVQLSLDTPKIVVFGNLLSSSECDAIVNSARPHLTPSKVVNMTTGGDFLDDSRTSYGMFFNRGQTPEVKLLEDRIARLVGWPVEKGEGVQVLKYGVGAEYKPHYDYFDPSVAATKDIIKRAGNRVGTVVVYLNDVTNGGGTYFPDVGLRVYPKKGSAVFFGYPTAHPSSLSLHGGDPVISGEKWIATKWLRQENFT